MKEIVNLIIMITDSQTNKLYLADCLPKKQPVFYERFKTVLDTCKINYDLLPSTKDIWARDYLPVQVATDKFVQFVYNPDYLQFKKYINRISHGGAICDMIGIKTEKSDIVLDGGNVIKASDKVILCDKVFSENPTHERKALRKKLEELFQVDKVYFVPQQPIDYLGHADGMVRFLDDTTVFINDYSKEDAAFRRAFLIALDNAGLDCIEIPYNPYKYKPYSRANGIYINYLQMAGVVFLPVFGQDEDESAVKRFEKLFSGYRIETIPSNEIADEGGILNCITWNIKIGK